MNELAARDPLHLLLEVLPKVVDDVGGARLPRETRFRLGGHRADHLGPYPRRNLAKEESYAAGRSVYQAALPALQPPRAARQVVRREPLEHEGRRAHHVNPVRHLHDVVRTRDDVRGVRPRYRAPRDAIADADLAWGRTESLDDARPFFAQRERERRLVEPRTVVDVDEVHAGRFDADADLAGAWLGRRSFDDPDLLGTPVRFDLGDSHAWERADEARRGQARERLTCAALARDDSA